MDFNVSSRYFNQEHQTIFCSNADHCSVKQMYIAYYD